MGRYSGKRGKRIFSAYFRRLVKREGGKGKQRLKEERDHLSKVGFIIGLHGGERILKKGVVGK